MVLYQAKVSLNSQLVGKEADKFRRPGLPTFLEKISKLYEMHVYTMGTRTYADAICKAVDPDGKIFGGRILSRDESGSESFWS